MINSYAAAVVVLSSFLPEILAVGQASPHKYASSVDHPRKILFKNDVIDTTHEAGLENQHFEALSKSEKASAPSMYVVQLMGPIRQEHKAEIERILGMKLEHYVPHHAFLISASMTQAHTISKLDFVLWINYFASRFRFNSQEIDRAQSRFRVLNEDDEASGTQRFQSDNIEIVVSLPRIGSSRPSKEVNTIVNQWQLTALTEIGLDFDVVAQSPERVLVNELFLKSVRVSSKLGLRTVMEWFANQPNIVHVALRESFELHNYFAKSLVQNDAPQTDTKNLLFEKFGLRGQGHIIAMGDSGIHVEGCYFQDLNNSVVFDHVDSATNASKLVAHPHRKIAQYITSGSGDNIDSDGHGTHVAGTLAGTSPSTLRRLQNHNGMAPDARIAVFDIEKDGKIKIPLDLELYYFPYSYAIGARVFSNSWGASASESDLGAYTDSSKSVDRFVWDNKDALILFSAGNDGTNSARTITPPATSKNAIAVGASMSSQDMFDHAYCEDGLEIDFRFCEYYRLLNTFHKTYEVLSSNSSLGPTSDNRIKPDLVAPGERIVSAGSRPCNRNWGGLHQRKGTSMATPVLAGHMLLVRQYFLEGFYPTGKATPADSLNPSAALLKAIAVNGAMDSKFRQFLNDNEELEFESMPPGPNSYEGFGRVNMKRSLYFAEEESTYHRIITPRSFDGKRDPAFTASGQTHTYTFCVSHVYSGHPPHFSLVWTDYPADLSATPTLVNNLDLVIQTNAQTYYANGGEGLDNVNTVERIRFASDVKPNLEIVVTVSAANIVESPQPYALVASGRIVQTTCEEEFPGGVVPEDRFIDLSLTNLAEKPLLTQEMIFYLSISSGTVFVFVALGCWLTFRKEKQKRHEEREDTPPSLQEHFRMAQLNPESGLAPTPIILQEEEIPAVLQTQVTGMGPILRQETNNAVVQQFKVGKVQESAFALD